MSILNKAKAAGQAVLSDARQVSYPWWLLLILRFYLAAFYIMTGLNKVMKGDWGLGYRPSVESFVTTALDKTWGFYRAFLEGIVVPNYDFFTLAVAWGETLLGFALLFGIFVRLAGGMGAFMAFNYALASGRAPWLPSFDSLLTLALLTLALASVGRIFGLDQYLKRFPKLAWAT